MAPLSWNSTRERLPGRQRRTRIHGGWINHLDSDNIWRANDLTPVEAGGVFTLSKAPYRVEIPRRAGDWLSFQSTNCYDIWTKQIKADQPVSIAKRYTGIDLTVVGVLDEIGIVFPLAFPLLLADRVIEFRGREMRDLVRFNAAPPGIGDIPIPFEIDFGQLPILESQGIGKLPLERDFSSDRTIVHGLSFTTGRFRGVKIKQPFVWDSDGKRWPITIVGHVEGSRFIGRKVIPRAFFRDAVFPVYADATTTHFPDPDPEVTTVDGFVLRQGTNLTWADIRDGAGTSASSNNVAVGNWLTLLSGTTAWALMRRGIQLYDTSDLDGGEITDASLNTKIGNSGVPGSDAFNQSVVAVASNPASNTDLATSDYGTLGTTAFCTAVDQGDLAGNTYEPFPLNASGIAAIDQDGISKFGFRFESDRANSEPSHVASSTSQVTANFAEQTGTASDPYLEVVGPEIEFTWQQLTYPQNPRWPIPGVVGY